MPRPGQRSSRCTRALSRAARRPLRRDPPCRPADRRAASPSSQRVARGSARGHLIHMIINQRRIQSHGCGPDAMEICGDLRKIAMKIPLGPVFWDRARKCKGHAMSVSTQIGVLPCCFVWSHPYLSPQAHSTAFSCSHFTNVSPCVSQNSSAVIFVACRERSGAQRGGGRAHMIHIP